MLGVLSWELLELFEIELLVSEVYVLLELLELVLAGAEGRCLEIGSVATRSRGEYDTPDASLGARRDLWTLGMGRGSYSERTGEELRVDGAYELSLRRER